MRLVARIRVLWRNLMRREHVEQSLDDELRHYIDLIAAEHERAGLTRAEARRAALVATGGVEQIKETTRDEWAGAALSSIARELNYAGRTLRRSPTFLVIAITTLAIGIGGATAVFTVIKASLLRPLPAVLEPDRLVTVERIEKAGSEAESSFPDYRDMAAQSSALIGLAGFNGTSMEVEDSASSARQWVSLVTDDFFTVLGVHPVAGRFWTATNANAKDQDTDPVAVLGYALWQRRFGGSAAVIGSRIKLDGTAFTIIGVAPPRFIGAMATHTMEIFIQMAPGGRTSPKLGDIDLSSRREPWLRLVGRLGPGKTLDDAQRDLAAIAARLAAAYPETNHGRSARVLPRTGMTAEERADMSRVPRLLAIAVAMLLLIACGNVASLSLVRAASRRRELATRVALGASRGSLVRQVALEGALSALGAGVFGVIVAQVLVHSAALVDTVVSMSDLDLALDPRVLAVALGASALTAILVSVMPAMQVSRLSPGAVLKDGGGAVRRSMGGQRVLVAAQVGASLVMLSGAAIIFSAFHRVLAAHDSLDPGGLVDAPLGSRMSIKDTTAQIAFVREVLARAAADPHIARAAFATTIPPFQWSGTALVFRQGEEPPPGSSTEQTAKTGLRVNAIKVSETFFDVMNIPVVRGRAFTTGDTRTSEAVAIVSRRLASILWPAQNPIGRVVAWPPAKGPARPPLRVVGVAEDTRDPSLAGDSPLAMYLSLAQQPSPWLEFLVRGRGGSVVPEAAIRRLVASVDPRVTVYGSRTLRDRLEGEVRPQRTASAWVGVFAAIALLLASIGLYGVVAQGVVQRTRELAVRSALGATPGGILATVLGDGMRVAAIGVIVGGLGSLAAVRVLRSLFGGVAANDPRPTAVAVAVLALAMVSAAYLPARRAARLNPADALRSD